MRPIDQKKISKKASATIANMLDNTELDNCDTESIVISVQPMSFHHKAAPGTLWQSTGALPLQVFHPLGESSFGLPLHQPRNTANNIEGENGITREYHIPMLGMLCELLSIICFSVITYL